MSKIRFGTNDEGYEELSVLYENEKVAVHQLLAVANGEDPYEVWSNGEYVTHHKRPIEWLNTPNNVTTITKAEHNRIHKPRERTSESDCESIREEIKQKTFEELSEKYGLCKGAVAKHVYGDCSHANTSAVVKSKGPRDGPWKNKELFGELYYEKDMTLAEIADELGCSQTTASKWKIKHEL